MNAPDKPAASSPRADGDRLPYHGDLFGEMYLAETGEETVTRRPLPPARYLPGITVVGVAAETAA